jgi:prepilin-type N-terminal cleavage/methylation domain-containing protein
MQVSAKHTGITLIECLVVITIIAILMGMAVPSFQWFKEIAQQKRVIYQLHAAVLTARHRSIMALGATYICPPPTRVFTGVGERPDCGDSYALGVAIWTEQGEDWRLLRLWQWSPMTITNRRGNQVVSAPVRFNAQGLANRNITWSTCVDGRNLSLVLNRVGRPDLRSHWGVC